MFLTPAMAVNEPGSLAAPEGLTAEHFPDQICFSWGAVEGAVKYSLEVTVEDKSADKVVEFSFSTGDRTDGLDPSVPKLCVYLTEFMADLDGDSNPEQVSGTAHVKVKALNPGMNMKVQRYTNSGKELNPSKNEGRQNNAFSNEEYYTQLDRNAPTDTGTEPGPTFCDPVFPWCN